MMTKTHLESLDSGRPATMILGSGKKPVAGYLQCKGELFSPAHTPAMTIWAAPS
jgi:hypothetical protein